MVEYQVKGSTINSKFDFVRLEFGVEAEQRLEAQLEQQTGAKRPFLDSTWYPFKTYVAILRLIARNHYRGDLSKLAAIGAGSADVTFAGTYRAFVRGDDFLRFLRRMPQLHTQFYSQGRIDVELLDDRRGCSIRHRGKDTYDEADLYVAQGFYQRAAELHGLDVIDCAFTLTLEGAEFQLRWAEAVKALS
jgi:hypothetical protein